MVELAESAGMQTCSIEPSVDVSAKYIKFQILHGHDAFASVHRLVVYGDSVGK
jgi:hypothetical protein